MRLRKSRLPDDVVARVGLNRGERVLVWITDPDGRYLVATESDLILQRRPPAYARIGWETIEHAAFKAGYLHLLVAEDSDLDQTTALQIPAGDDINLPIVVRDRVTASIAVNEHVDLEGELGVRVVARRRAGQDALIWGFRTDSKLQLTPELRSRAEQAVRDVRASLALQ